MRILANAGLCATFLLLWSSGWIGSKFAVGLTGHFTFLSWRYLLVVALLGIFVVATRQWRSLGRAEYLQHLNVGVLSHGIFLGASLGAMKFGTSAGMVALVTGMQPLFTAIVAIGVMYCGSSNLVDRPPGKLQWFGILLGLTAIVIVVGDQIILGGSALAYLLLFASMGAISLATLIDRAATLKLSRVKASPAPLPQILLLHSIAGYGFFSLFAWVLEGYSIIWSSSLVWTVLYMAIVVSIGSYALMFLLLRKMSVFKVASLAYLTPPTTMLMAWLVFNETLTQTQWLGLVVAGIAVSAVYLGESRSKADKTKTAVAVAAGASSAANTASLRKWVILHQIDIDLGNPDIDSNVLSPVKTGNFKLRPVRAEQVVDTVQWPIPKYRYAR